MSSYLFTSESVSEGHPDKMADQISDSILDAIEKVTESAQQLIRDPSFKGVTPEILQHLGTLIRINHGFLVSLGVSHPRLERIRELVDFANIGWTKLTASIRIAPAASRRRTSSARVAGSGSPSIQARASAASSALIYIASITSASRPPIRAAASRPASRTSSST